VDVRGGSGGFFGRDSDPQGQAGGKGSASRAEAIPAPPALCLVGFGLVALWASKRPRFRPISRRGTVRRSPAGRPARSA
jgi:hypothetical protein